MANNNEASTSGLAKEGEDKYEEIVRYLPPRFREINTNSEDLKCFILMNADFIRQRILPGLDRRVHHLILNARPGLLFDRLKDIIVNVESGSNSQSNPNPSCPALLIQLPTRGEFIRNMKLYDWAVRDKRLPPLPNQLREITAAFPKSVRYSSESEQFIEGIGQKVVYWSKYNPKKSFAYIANVDHNGVWAFRALDTSTICRKIQAERSGRGRDLSDRVYQIVRAVVGHRLIVLLQFIDRYVSNELGPIYTMALDADSERWTLLPQCPEAITEYMMPISWKGKLFLVDPSALNRGTGNIVHMHHDLESNTWKLKADDPNIAFENRLLEFSGRYKVDRNLRYSRRAWIISSRSGTLYAFCRDRQSPERYDVYAMDDLTIGWEQVKLFPSRPSLNDLAVPTLNCSRPPIDARPDQCNWRCSRVTLSWYCWEVNEDDVLFLDLQLEKYGQTVWYCWWIFNKDDGLKSFNWEKITRPSWKKNMPMPLSLLTSSLVARVE